MYHIVNQTIRTDQKFSVSMLIIVTVGILAIGLTATMMMTPTAAQASGNPCPSGDSCTCNSQSGVLTDNTNGHQVNDGCTNDNNGNPLN
jgi:hypothetical protein